MIRYCEYCKKEIDENNVYGKGRFCNKRCQILSIKDKGRQTFIENAKNRKQERTVKKICPCCGQEFETVVGRRDELKFCSKHCSATYSGNKSRVVSDATKQKISESLKATLSEKIVERKKRNVEKRPKEKLAYKHGRIKFNKPQRFCTICNKNIEWDNKTGLCQHCLRTTEQGRKILSENAKKVAESLISEGRHVGWKMRNISSYAEKFWKEVLDNNNVSYVKEKVQKYGPKCSDKYFLDFYIESNGRKIDLEIDGKQHKYVDRAEHDRVRDERLTNLGYVVYRIDWNEINSEKGKLRMKEKIDKFLDFLNK